MFKRNSLTVIFLLLIASIIWSCDNELDVHDTWRETPIIYGMLDPLDSLHIVKITKAFLGEGDAIMMAQIPDSSYYGDELTVQLIEISPEGYFTRTWDFDTMWIHNKQEGTFFGGDQMLYKVPAELNPTHRYMITLQNEKSGFFCSATTAIVRPVSINRPRGGQRFFSFTSGAEIQVEMTSSPNGRIYQLVIRFNYKEVNINSNDTTEKYVDWVFPNRRVSGLGGGDRIIYSFPGTGFYSNIAAQVKPDPDMKRIPGNVDFIAYAGGDELSTYINISRPQTTIVQERPEFTNVTNGGLGIFSSRTSYTRSCELTPQSIDSLVNGSKTNTRGFVFPKP